MGETAENVAEERNVSREDQDRFACRSQEQAAAARAAGRFEREIAPVAIPQRKGDPRIVAEDEFIRPGRRRRCSAKLKPAFRAGGSVDRRQFERDQRRRGGAAGRERGDGRTARARRRWRAFVASAVAGVEPRTMGMGPVPASRLALARAGLTLDDMDVIELNEAFAAQALACMRELGIDDDDPRVNPNGGAIALGHPLGMSGARLLLTAAHELRETGGRYALATMCVGVGQGMAAIIERGMIFEFDGFIPVVHESRVRAPAGDGHRQRGDRARRVHRARARPSAATGAASSSRTAATCRRTAPCTCSPA